MIGDLNPKTLAEYTRAERTLIEAVQPHNLLHNSATRRDSINGLSLLANRNTMAESRPKELKTMVVAHEGT